MGQTFSSPQNIIKGIVNLALGALSLATSLIGTSIKRLLGNFGTDIAFVVDMVKFIENFIEQTEIFVKQIETTVTNIVNVITNVDQLNSFYSLISDTTDLPGDNTEETELYKVLYNEADGATHIPIEPKYDCIYQVELFANYYSWLIEDGTLNRKSTQVLTYQFSIPDQNGVDTLEDLITVPQLLSFEDRTPPIINGTTVPSPMSEVALHLKFVFTKPGPNDTVTEVVYDPESDAAFPAGVTVLKAICLKSSLIFDRSVLSSASIVTEKLKIRGNVNVQCDRVPDNAADIAVDN